jgi:Holliday junction resolvase RusA-like endonuclease
MTYTIIIDQKTMKDYEVDYFLTNIRARVFPNYFKRPIPPSLNKFTALKRMTQNAMKQKYKQFAIWLIKENNLDNKNFEKIEMSYKLDFSNNRRRDTENYLLAPKFLNDGFVEAGLISDDHAGIFTLKFEPIQLGCKEEKMIIEINVLS